MTAPKKLISEITLLKKQTQLRLRKMMIEDYPEENVLSRFDEAYTTKKLQVRKLIIQSMIGFHLNRNKN